MSHYHAAGVRRFSVVFFAALFILNVQTAVAVEQTNSTLPSPAFISNPDSVPDAVIATKSLSDLPRDILRQSSLKEVLTDDFVFYYQESEGYLSLKGSLKRIAFEHDMSLFDEILSYSLKTPAELALWKSYNGRLDEFMLVVDRNLVMDIITAVAKVAIDDQQLTVHAEKSFPSIGKVTVYKLNYGTRTLYFGGLGKKLVIFSHPDMPLPTADKLEKWSLAAKEKFGVSNGEGTFSRLFEPEAIQSKHALYFTAKFLSFGYQKLFPSFDSIKFQYSEKSDWKTEALLQGQTRQSNVSADSIWKVIPRNPAFCAAIPVDSSVVGDLFGKLFRDREKEAKSFVAGLKTPASICWYSDSKLFAPLIVAQLTGPPNVKFMRDVFDRSVGNFEAGILTEAEMEQYREQQRKIQAKENVDDPIRAAHFEKPFPVLEVKKKDGVILSREVSSKFGIYDVSKSKNAAKMRSQRFFNVRMAQWKNYLVFSPDDKLVDNAIAVIDKKFPALSDSIPRGAGNVGFILMPGKVGALLKTATIDSLPAEQESVFRESVSRRLFPAFDRMKNIPASAVSWPIAGVEKTRKWEELKWSALSSK